MGKEGAAAKIKELQDQRVQTLSRLAAVYLGQYREGRIDINPVFAAENDLLDAQVEAAGKPEQRIVLLTAAIKRTAEFERTVEERLKAGRANPADLEWARAISLDVQIRLSIEQNAPAAEIRACGQNVLNTLTRVVARYDRLYQMGRLEFEPVFDVQVQLANARLDATEKHAERVALLEELVKGAAERLRVTEDKYHAAIVGDASPLQARSLLLDAKIRLSREREKKQKQVRHPVPVGGPGGQSVSGGDGLILSGTGCLTYELTPNPFSLC